MFEHYYCLLINSFDHLASLNLVASLKSFTPLPNTKGVWCLAPLAPPSLILLDTPYDKYRMLTKLQYQCPRGTKLASQDHVQILECKSTGNWNPEVFSQCYGKTLKFFSSVLRL